MVPRVLLLLVFNMENLTTLILTTAFAITGIISAMGYIPQVYTLWKDNTSAGSTSIRAWITWTITSGVGMMYSIFIINDMFIVGNSVMQFVGCAAVLLMSIYKRYQLPAQ